MPLVLQPRCQKLRSLSEARRNLKLSATAWDKLVDSRLQTRGRVAVDILELRVQNNLPWQ